MCSLEHAACVMQKVLHVSWNQILWRPCFTEPKGPGWVSKVEVAEAEEGGKKKLLLGFINHTTT